MKRLGLILLVAIFITGCKNTGKTLENNTDKSGNNTGVSLTEKNSAQSISEEEGSKVSEVENENVEGKDTILPEYTYTGSDGIMKTICDYLKKMEVNKNDEEIYIPAPVIFLVNDDNAEDIQIYGNFWKHYYKKDGNNLLDVGGGENPGRFHLKKNGNEYEIISFDKVGDGSDYAKDIKEICKDSEPYIPSDYLYNLYMKHCKVNDENTYVRKVFIERYVEENGLDIVSFQDFGWDKVMLEPVKKVSFNGKLYRDTGEIFYFMTCGTMDFKIEDSMKSGELSLDKNQTNFGACDGQLGYGENKIGLYFGDRLHIFEADK